MKLRGKLEKQFFGGSVWVLKDDDGATWQLQGKVPAGLNGERVVVSGRKAETGFSLGMVGDVFEVHKIARG